MTEDEAKDKWCPFVRIAVQMGNGGATANRGAGDGTGGPYDLREDNRCLGSGCMAWQWAWREFARPSKDQGFCGLAR